MKPAEYELMHRVQDRHWWYRGMQIITCGLLDRFVGPGRGLRVLEAGCGTGAVMDYLSRYGSVTGLDHASEGLRFCRERGASRLVRGSILELPFAPAAFDLITSFDVLDECGPRDVEGLAELHRVLAPGGHLLLRLPAYEWLRGRHDDFIETVHRYNRGELRRKLVRAGFQVEHTSYANSFLFPLAALKRLKDRLLPPEQSGSDLTVEPGPLDGLFGLILSSEARLVRSPGLPFGLTVLALARKL